MYAVVRVRGSAKTPKEIEDTLKMLRLTRTNHCVVIPKNKSYEGMLQKVKSYVTWGEIDKDVLEELVVRRGRYQGDKKIDPKEAKKIVEKIYKEKSVKVIDNLKPVFRLSPPSKGYKSVKLPYPKGDLGYRGEKINELLRRMI